MTPKEQEKTGEPRVEDHPAFGMWAGRDDLKNPSAVVRRMRQGIRREGGEKAGPNRNPHRQE